MNDLPILNLHKNEEIYFNNQPQSVVSFPVDGHQKLVEIEENSFWFNHRLQFIKKLVKEYKVDDCFYDVGGGNGYVSKGLQDEGYKVALVEPVLAGVKTANKRGVTNCICAEFQSLEFVKSPKYVGLFDVIEHIEHDRKFLSEIYSKLDHQGLVFITVPAFQFLWSNIDQESGHFRRYSLQDLERVVESSGLKVERSGYYFTYLLPLMLLIKRKSKGDTASEHKVSAFSSLILKFLNFFDRLLFQVLGGKFPGASIILVGKKL